MPKPDFITEENLNLWDQLIKQDPLIKQLPPEIANSNLLKDVMYAGLWLSEELEKHHCPPSILEQIQYYGGQLSFGRDPWDVHQEILKKYLNNQLIIDHPINEQFN